MLINRPVQIRFNNPEMVQIFLIFSAQFLHIDILFFQLMDAFFHHFPVILKLLFRVADGIQILHQDFLVILYRIIQGISPYPAHGFLNLLKLNPQQIKYIFYLVHGFIITLLFQMHLKDHFMNGQFHITLHFQRGQQKTVAVIREIIRRALDLSVNIDHPIGHIAYIHPLIGSLLKIKPFKIHGTSLIAQYRIYNKIPQLFTFFIGNILSQILHIQRIYVSSNIIQRTIFFFQRLFHNIQKHCKNHINLLMTLDKSILFPCGFLETILNQQRIQPHIFHPFREILQKIVLHSSSFLLSSFFSSSSRKSIIFKIS